MYKKKKKKKKKMYAVYLQKISNGNPDQRAI